MKKPSPTKASVSRKKDAGQPPPPKTLTPAAAQAALEDAVMGAAADIAALSATLEERTDAPEPELLIGAIVAETPEEQKLLDLIAVPLLGPARIRALAEMGILTLDDLHAAPPEQIARLKGVGANNAQRIKEWVAQHPHVAAAPAPPPPSEAAAVSPATGPDPSLGDDNQAIYDELGAVDDAITRLTERLGPSDRAKRLRRQLDRVSTVASELAEGPDTLTSQSLHHAVGLLDQIAHLLNVAVSEKKLTEKRQQALCDALRILRKSLQKTVEG